MDQKKIVTLNQEFLKIPRSAGKGTTSKRKSKPKSLGEDLKLKKKLLSRIHEFQSRKDEKIQGTDIDTKALDVEEEIQVFDTKFNDSIDYLAKLASQNKRHTMRKKNRKKNKNTISNNNGTIRMKKPADVNINVETQELPTATSSHIQSHGTDVKTEVTNSPITQELVIPGSSSIQLVSNNSQPPYTCLKNSRSSKPTYRQWMTRKNKHSRSPENNVTNEPV